MPAHGAVHQLLHPLHLLLQLLDGLAVVGVAGVFILRQIRHQLHVLGDLIGGGADLPVVLRHPDTPVGLDIAAHLVAAALDQHDVRLQHRRRLADPQASAEAAEQMLPRQLGGAGPGVVVDLVLLAVLILQRLGVQQLLRHRIVGAVARLLVILGLLLLQLLFQLIQLRLQLLLPLGLLQQRQVVLGILQLARLAVVLDPGPLHLRLRQGGVVAYQLHALFHLLPLGNVDLAHRLGRGKIYLLQIIRGHSAASVGRVAPVVGHGKIADGVHVHVAPLGVAGDGQPAPHRAADGHGHGGDDNGLFQLFIHTCHLPTEHRRGWS